MEGRQGGRVAGGGGLQPSGEDKHEFGLIEDNFMNVPGVSLAEALHNFGKKNPTRGKTSHIH